MAGIRLERANSELTSRLGKAAAATAGADEVACATRPAGILPAAQPPRAPGGTRCAWLVYQQSASLLTDSVRGKFKEESERRRELNKELEKLKQAMKVALALAL